MHLVASIGGYLLDIEQIDEAAWESLKNKKIVGIPTFAFQNKDGAVFVWPQPSEGCQVCRLEPQPIVKP